MALEIRPVSFSTQREELLDVLHRNLPDVPHLRRFEWLYRNQPCGNPRSWFLVDRGADRAVGTVSLFPRALQVGNGFIPCGQVGNFAVDKAYRTLGPALMLQKATLESVEAGHFAVCYDCPPHSLGMSTFRRLGMKENCLMHRYVRLIRTNRQFQKIFGDRASSRLLAAAGNVVLGLTSIRFHGTRGVDVSIHTGRFGDEFTRLDRDLATAGRIRNRRWAEDLNWRFYDDPLNRYTTVTARRNGELAGFALFTVEGSDARLIDISGATEIFLPLLESVVDSARQAGTESLQAMVSDSNPLKNVLNSLGFRFRSEHARVVAHCSSAQSNLQLGHREKWALTHADILA